MQLINTKISYEIGETEVFTTQLINNDYSINIHIKENLLKIQQQIQSMKWQEFVHRTFQKEPFIGT